MQKRFNRNDFIILCYFKVHNKFISIFLRKSYNGFYMPIYLTFDSWLKSMMMVSLVYAYTSHVQRKQDLTDFWQRHSKFWHFLVHTLYTMLFYNFLKVKKSGTPRSHPSFPPTSWPGRACQSSWWSPLCSRRQIPCCFTFWYDFLKVYSRFKG